MNESTRARLLQHAGRLFAAGGYEGTSVREITSTADANLGAVTYHFGSKRKLYEAVLDQLLGSFADRIESVSHGSDTARERLCEIIHVIFQFFAEYPEAPRLIIRELARAGEPPPVAVRHARRNLTNISDVIREGQQSGELRDVEPVLAVFTMLSQSIWFALVRRQLSAVTGIPLDKPESAGLMERHITEVVLRAFQRDGAAQ